MNSHHHSTAWLLDSQLVPYVDAFTHHLTERRYASNTVDTYLGCIAHFAHWSTQCRLAIHCIDEKVVQQFLDDHLTRCDCARQIHRVRRDLRAARTSSCRATRQCCHCRTASGHDSGG
jgi:site-specific recombinase XerD